MMIFQRYLLKELLRNTITTLVVLVVILMLVMSARIVHQVAGLDLATFGMLLPLAAAVDMGVLLPIAVLVAVVLTYSRAAADNELDTLRASGVHPFHVYVPGLVFGALMTCVLVWSLDDGVPLAGRYQKKITKEANLSNVIRQQLNAGEPVKLSDDTVLSVESFHPVTGLAQGMRIQQFDEETDELVFEIVGEGELSLDADALKYVLTLENFRTLKGNKMTGDKLIIERDLPREDYQLHSEHLSSAQLLAWQARPERSRLEFNEREVDTEVGMRLSLAVACTLFVLLGIPVSMLFRSHDRVAGYLVAFLLALFVYYPSQQISLALAASDALPVDLAAWGGNAFLLVVGLALSWKAVRR